MNKTPIVILPGWLLGVERYYELKKIFAEHGYSTFVVDFPGFATKRLNKVLDLKDYVKYLQNYLKKNQIKKAIFIAHSFGGRVALKMLSQDPQKAKLLIISGTPGYLTVPHIKLKTFYIIAKIGGGIFSLPLLNITKNFIRKLYYKIIGAKDFYHTEGFVRETFKNIIKEPLIDYMQKIRIPTLLLWGENDQIVPPTIGEKMQRTIANSQLIIIPNEKHSFICNNSKLAFNKCIDFIRKYE